MKIFVVAILCFGIAGCAGLAQPEDGPQTTIRVEIPKTVSDSAQARLAGTEMPGPPVLVLEGVELGYKEGVTIQVVGGGEVLGSASMVGRGQPNPAPPLSKMTLLVPLNERSLKLLAGKQQVEFTLRIGKNPARAPVKIDRAYFQ